MHLRDTTRVVSAQRTPATVNYAEAKEASAFFEKLNRANLYAIAYRLSTAKKPETRQRRMAQILEMLAKGEKFP